MKNKKTVRVGDITIGDVGSGANVTVVVGDNNHISINKIAKKICKKKSLSLLEIEQLKKIEKEKCHDEAMMVNFDGKPTQIFDFLKIRRVEALLKIFDKHHRVCMMMVKKDIYSSDGLRIIEKGKKRPSSGYVIKKDDGNFYVITARHSLSNRILKKNLQNNENNKTSEFSPFMSESNNNIRHGYQKEYNINLASASATLYYDSTPNSEIRVEFDPSYNCYYGTGVAGENDFAVLKINNHGQRVLNSVEKFKEIEVYSFKSKMTEIENGIGNCYVTTISHPNGKEKVFGIPDEIVEVDTANSRLKYETNTKAGSSGCPVFFEDGTYIAVHNNSYSDKSDPNFNINQGFLLREDTIK